MHEVAPDRYETGMKAASHRLKAPTKQSSINTTRPCIRLEGEGSGGGCMQAMLVIDLEGVRPDTVQYAPSRKLAAHRHVAAYANGVASVPIIFQKGRSLIEHRSAILISSFHGSTGGRHSDVYRCRWCRRRLSRCGTALSRLRLVVVDDGSTVERRRWTFGAHMHYVYSARAGVGGAELGRAQARTVDRFLDWMILATTDASEATFMTNHHEADCQTARSGFATACASIQSSRIAASGDIVSAV